MRGWRCPKIETSILGRRKLSDIIYVSVGLEGSGQTVHTVKTLRTKLAATYVELQLACDFVWQLGVMAKQFSTAKHLLENLIVMSASCYSSPSFLFPLDQLNSHDVNPSALLYCNPFKYFHIPRDKKALNYRFHLYLLAIERSSYI